MDQKQKYPSLLQEGEFSEEKIEELAVEKPLQINVNNKQFSLTMQTPGNERYLVRGLLHSEGVIHSEFVEYEQQENESGTTVSVKVNCSKEIRSNRNLTSVSSCGLCGKKDINNLLEGITPVTRQGTVSAVFLKNIYHKIAAQQNLFQKTGGCHAASAATEDGEILCVFEDIGRHNAVDKVVGFLLENNLLEQAHLLTVSGRVSFEIIQKCARAGIPCLSAISAPSSLAVETANQWNITLAAFCRADRATFYSGLQRVTSLLNSAEL